MARYVLIALNGPTAGLGDEETYNEWYNDVHLPELRRVPGVVSARRYKVEDGKNAAWPYVAVYEVETDDTNQFMQDLATKPRRPFTPAFDSDNSAFVFAAELSD